MKICKRLNGNHSRSKRSKCIPKCTGFSKIQCSVCVSKMAQKTRVEKKFPYKPILHYVYAFLKETNSAINRSPLGLYALFYRTPAKIMLHPQAQTVQYRFLRRSKRLYGNKKSPLSCISSGSLQNIFEMIGAVRTIKWKPGLTRAFHYQMIKQ